jgi:1-hydroxycarotenoid 3,4-desaturase
MRNSTAFSILRARPGPARVVVIGAGIGGLVAALSLAVRGCAVTLVERAETPGGKLRTVQVADRLVDAGPTVFTLRAVFEEIFAEAGTSLAAHLTLVRPDILARHAWRGGARFDLFADVERSVEAIGDFAGPDEGRRYRAFCDRARRVYRLLDRPFIRSDRPSLGRLLRAVRPSRDVLAMAPFTTLWNALGDYFHDPRLRQLFGRYATYCGASPFLCPATLMLVAHVEQDGVWLIEGGMHRLAVVLAALAKAQGAVLRYGAGAKAIHVAQGRAAGVDLETGERIAADAVVCNADIAALAGGLLGQAVSQAANPVKPDRRSLSAITFALAEPVEGFALQRHNVFFSDDYAAEFDDLLRHRRLPRAPTVYVCAQDRNQHGALPRQASASAAAAERLFCIVNAPPNGDTHSFDASEIALCEERTFRTLDRCGLTLPRRSDAIHVTTPNDFDRLFPATGGALYGAASHGWMASFRRPGLRSKVPGLYLCGGSTHPGPGLPMAALSGQMAASSLIEDWASRLR